MSNTDGVPPPLELPDEDPFANITPLDPFANITPLDVQPRTGRRVMIPDGATSPSTRKPGEASRLGRKRMSVIDAISLEHRRHSAQGMSEDDEGSQKAMKRRASNAFEVSPADTSHEVGAQIDQSSISKAEYANIVKMFQFHDADGSGSIDSKELRTVMLSLGHQLTDSQLEDLMYEITGQKDCALDFEDFVKLILFWKDAARFRLFERETAPAQEHIEAASDTHGKFLPDHPFRRLWDLMMLATAVLIYGTSTFLYCIVANEEAVTKYRSNLLPMEIAGSILITLDIVVSCFTVQLDGRHIMCETSEIVGRYARKWLIVDLISVLPYWLFVSRDAAAYVNWIRLFRCCKVFDLFQTSGRLPMNPGFVEFYFRALPLIQGLTFFLCLVHSVAVIQIYLQPDGALTMPYVTAIYWALLLLSGVGSDVVEGSDNATNKQWYGISVMIAGQLTNAIAVGNLVRYFQISDIAGVRAEKLAETAAVCQFFSIPEALGNEILQFQDHILQHNLSVAYFNLIKGLPNEMKVHIGIYARIRLIRGHPLFALGHEAVRVAVAQALEAAVYTPEEYVVLADDVDDDMFIVAHGFLDVLSKSSGYVGTLKAGDHFGEVSLFHEVPHSFSVKTLTYCELYALSGYVFSSILERFNTYRRDVDQLLDKMHMEAASQAPLGQSIAMGSEAGLHDLSFLSNETFEAFTEHKRHLAEEALRRASVANPTAMSMEALEAEMSRAEIAAAGGGLFSPSNALPATPRRKNWKGGVPPTPRSALAPQEEPPAPVPTITDLAVRKSRALCQTASVSRFGDDMMPSTSSFVAPHLEDIELSRLHRQGTFTSMSSDEGKVAKSKRFEDRKRLARENDLVAIAQQEMLGSTEVTSPSASFRKSGTATPSVVVAGATRHRSAFGSSVSSDVVDLESCAIVPPALERAAMDALIKELQAQVEELTAAIGTAVLRIDGP